MNESRSCGELMMKASCAVVFPSNICEPAEKRKGDGALVWEWTVQTGSLSSNGTFEVSVAQAAT